MRTYKKSGGGMFDCAKRTDDRAPKPARLDLPATRQYLKGLWDTNGSFSEDDTRTKAMAIDSLLLLGCDDERVYESAKTRLLSLENKDWGFSSENGQDSTLEGTHYAVSCLKKLGVEKKEAADYILRLHRGNGSFVRDEAHSKIAATMPGGELDSLYNAALAVLTLNVTG